MPIPLLSSPFEEVRSYSKESVGPEMAIKRPKPKEIVVKLRQVTQFDAHSRNWKYP
jgi:signal recognition particle subunit SEC65